MEISKEDKTINPAFNNSNTAITPDEWVNHIIVLSVKERASDIHIEPYHNKFSVRFRIDGIVHQIEEQPINLYDMVVSRFKILAQLDIAERRKPQEGRGIVSPTELKGKDVSFRLSTFPTIFGEAIVIRLADQESLVFENFEAMDMRPEQAEVLRELIERPHGMILITGPAGSGKTATLYTILNHIRAPNKTIVTLEDPVEYQLEYVRHSQINLNIGFDFATGVRSILRQDPDVIMIGEIRDPATAEIAVRGALSGRLLLSTLHTNDAIGTMPRYLEFGVAPSLLASALLLAIAKRLIRRNCENCLEPYIPTKKTLEKAGFASLENIQFMHGKGCKECGNSGFKGRLGVFEFFIMDREFESLVVEKAPFEKIREVALAKGMRTLREEATRLAMEGKTTLEEALHATA